MLYAQLPGVRALGGERLFGLARENLTISIKFVVRSESREVSGHLDIGIPKFLAKTYTSLPISLIGCVQRLLMFLEACLLSCLLVLRHEGIFLTRHSCPEGR